MPERRKVITHEAARRNHTHFSNNAEAQETIPHIATPPVVIAYAADTHIQNKYKDEAMNLATKMVLEKLAKCLATFLNYFGHGLSNFGDAVALFWRRIQNESPNILATEVFFWPRFHFGYFLAT